MSSTFIILGGSCCSCLVIFGGQVAVVLKFWGVRLQLSCNFGGGLVAVVL